MTFIVPLLRGFFIYVLPSLVSYVVRNWRSVLVLIGVGGVTTFTFTTAIGGALETLENFQWIIYLLLIIAATIATIRIYFYWIDERDKRKRK